ncbi:MerR family transcriptional regulator [Mesobacterium pallidum]|uniref:MerR family transcriptional regulator n=1 Tax=Mesobacterium pallidum TaxID=2872037 RepID=UPI001EE2AF78|nr:MerR family transcriptional regulator [Mesobacterium pallidum]
MAKSLTIRDMAGMFNVSNRTLRYYEEKGLIEPARGAGRSRRYDQSHVKRMLDIQTFTFLGMQLDEVREALNCGGPSVDRLMELRGEAVADLSATSERLARIDVMIANADLADEGAE